MKVLGALGHAGVGAAVGAVIGGGVGVTLGGAGGALGAAILKDALHPSNGVARELGDLVNTAFDMGLVGNGILLGSIGLFAGAGVGLAKGGYMSCASLSVDAQGWLLGLLIAAAVGAPVVGGLIGQDLLKDRSYTEVSGGESAIFDLTGTGVIVLSLAFLAFAGYFIFEPRCDKAAGDQPSSSPTP